MVSLSTAAPGALERVRQFVNTLDIEAGTDQIAEPHRLRQWLAAHGHTTGVALSAADVSRVIELREALREAAAANHDGSDVPSDARKTMNRWAAQAQLTVEFTADCGYRSVSRSGGVDGAIGALLVIVTDAMTDRTWARLKVCTNDLCRWAFYDNSRARTGKWCSMQVCGNRAKQRAWRDRHATQHA